MAGRLDALGYWLYAFIPEICLLKLKSFMLVVFTKQREPPPEGLWGLLDFHSQKPPRNFRGHFFSN